MESDTSIRISKKTVGRLKKAGYFGEKYEDVIIRLLDNWEEEGR